MDNTRIRPYFLAIVTTLIAILALYILRPFLVTIGLAAVFSVIFTPLHGRLKKFRMPDMAAALLSLVIGLLCVLIPLSILSVQLFREVESVYASVSQPGSLEHMRETLTSIGGKLNGIVPGTGTYFNSLSANIDSYTRGALAWTLGAAPGIFTGTAAFVLQLFVFLMTLYYFLKEGPHMRAAIAKYSPLTPAETLTLGNRMSKTINAVVRGAFFVALIQGLLAGIGFLIFGVPNAVLWGTVTVIAALVPAVGTLFVFGPAILYLLFVGHTGSAIGLLIYAVGFVGIIDNALKPYLMGGKETIHPILVLLSVLGGVAFFGAAGLFLGPLVISLLVGLLSLYSPSHAAE